VRLDRRWWIAIGVGVVVVIALIYSNNPFRQPSEDCRPVLEMLEFNQSQAEVIASKTGDSDGVPNQAEEIAYQAWADGLADRARNVSAPELAFTAGQVARLADDFVGKMATLRTQAQNRAPGAPTPPVVYEMDALNNEISRKFAELSDACER
jgi:hypothetical protein